MTIEEIQQFAQNLNPPIALTEIQTRIIKEICDGKSVPALRYRQAGWTQTLMIADLLALRHSDDRLS